MNNDEEFPLGNDAETQYQDTNTEAQELEDELDPVEGDEAEFAEENEDAEPAAEVAAQTEQPQAYRSYIPANPSQSAAQSYLNENLEPEMAQAISALLDERVNYALQGFAAASGGINYVSQQEQVFAARYGGHLAAITASASPVDRADPDFLDKATAAAVFAAAKANNRSFIAEMKDFNSLNSTRTQPLAPKRPTMTPSGRMPSGGQGARPAGNGQRRGGGESLATQYMKSLGFDDAEARQLARIKD